MIISKDRKLTVIRNVLIVINILLLISMALFIFKSNITLSYRNIEKEIHSIVGKEYEVRTYDINENLLLITAITDIKDDKNYDSIAESLINKLNKYKQNNSLDEIIIRFEYRDGDTRYLIEEY